MFETYPRIVNRPKIESAGLHWETCAHKNYYTYYDDTIKLENWSFIELSSHVKPSASKDIFRKC